MRKRERIETDMLIAAQPSSEDKYPLRLLKAELLTVELLMDIRDLLQTLQRPTIITAGGDSDGRDERIHHQNHQHP